MFGFAMQEGQLVVNEAEAELVKMIFARYSEGTTLQQLADELNRQPIPYSSSSERWDKHMIARIIANKRYLGAENIPAIITGEDWASAASSEMARQRTQNYACDYKTVRQLARCACCGRQPEMVTGPRRGTRRWRCTNCGSLTTKASTDVVIYVLSELINMLCEQPDLVQIVETPKIPERIHLNKQESEFTAAINNTAFDEDRARQAAFSLASARLDALGSEDYETCRIRHALIQTEKAEDLNDALLKSIAVSVLIHPEGTVSLKLKNNQIIGRSVIPCQIEPPM